MSTSQKRELRNRQADQCPHSHMVRAESEPRPRLCAPIPAPTTVALDAWHPALDLYWVPWQPARFLAMVTTPAQVQVTLMAPGQSVSLFCVRRLAGTGVREFGWRRLEGKA